MASGSVQAAPPRSTNHRSGVHLTPGQLCTGVISIQRVLYQVALSTATHHEIMLSTQPPAWQPLFSTNIRPFIFLQRTLQGIHVLPLSTFQGHKPETWNLLLQEIVVPIGDRSTISPMFHDRRAFQTEPAWTHREGHPTYIFPEIVVLPLDATLRRLPAAMSPSMARELKLHCRAIIMKLQANPRESVQLMIRSFEANPYGEKTWTSTTSATIEEHEDPGVQDRAAKSSLNPHAAAFVPRALCYDAMSFPGLANASNCGSTILFSVPPSISSINTPSIHQALQDNVPLPIAYCEIDPTPRKPSHLREGEDDKENMRP